MKIKTQISILFTFAIINFVFVNITFAEISLDDIELLMEKEYGGSTQPSGPVQTQSKPDFATVNVPNVKQKSPFDAIRGDIVLVVEIIVGFVFLRFFIAYLKKIKKLTAEAQLARDMAEKHLYNAQNISQTEHGKINMNDKTNTSGDDVNLNISVNAEELESIITKRINSILRQEKGETNRHDEPIQQTKTNPPSFVSNKNKANEP